MGALSQEQKDALSALLSSDDEETEEETEDTDEETEETDDDTDEETDEETEDGGGSMLVLTGKRADSFLDRFLGVGPPAAAKKAPAKKAAPAPAKKAAAKKAPAKKAAPAPQDPPPPRTKFFS
jgi:hypothetical protein